MPTGKNKKTLYKIPTEDEIQGAVPAKPLKAKPAPEVTPEVEEVLPVVEPEPVAVVDTAKEKEKAAAEALAKSEAKAADDAAKAAKLEAESVKAEAKAKEKAAREAKMADGYVFARSRVESDSMPDVPKMKKAKGKGEGGGGEGLFRPRTISRPSEAIEKVVSRGLPKISYSPA